MMCTPNSSRCSIDKDNFVLLVKELREAMPDKLITAAVAVSPEKQDAGYSSELGDLFDLTFVMAYVSSCPDRYA